MVVVAAAAPVVGEDDGLVEVAVGLVGEDVERHLDTLLLDVLDEDCDLHRTANLNTVMGFHPSNILALAQCSQHDRLQIPIPKHLHV